MSPVLDPVDYYGLCQEGVMNLLRSLTYFQAKPTVQVSTNRNNINTGAEYWAVFLPNTFSSSKIDVHNKRYEWITVFDLYVRYKTAAESVGKFMEVRSSIINWLDVHPTLNGVLGVENVSLNTRSVLLQDTPGDNPNFMIQTLAVTIAQRIVRKF
jgi:hypothetical protein